MINDIGVDVRAVSKDFGVFRALDKVRGRITAQASQLLEPHPVRFLVGLLGRVDADHAFPARVRVVHGRDIEPLHLREDLFGARKMVPRVSGRIRQQDTAAGEIEQARAKFLIRRLQLCSGNPTVSGYGHEHLELCGRDGQGLPRHGTQERAPSNLLNGDRAAQESSHVEHRMVRDTQH